eukprot:jgi/Psemu1/288602/fgenesh1_pg.277_\
MSIVDAVMVKRQKEKQYLSAREQREQGRSRSNPNAASSAANGVVQKSLPFKCCALTLVPFETPVCTVVNRISNKNKSKNNSNGSNGNGSKHGIVFDNTALMEFVWKHKKDPVTGNPMKSSEIIRLHMDRDSETGNWQCPVLTKAFSDHTTKIVAVISPSGGNEAYVYSYEAYHELNVKPKNYVDLTTGLKFSPKNDVIVLNDPSDPTFQKDVQKERRERETREREEQQQKDAAAAKAVSRTAAEDGFSFEVPGANLSFRVPTEDVTGVKYTSGAAAGGLTSTSTSTSTAGTTTGLSSSSLPSRAATPDEILESRLKVMASKANKGKKGYVRMVVTIEKQGDLHSNSNLNSNPTPIVVPLLLELHCDIAPRTCTNFLGLCRNHRYDGAIFHRYIADFMIQGGGEKGKQPQPRSQPASGPAATTTAAATSGRDVCLWGPDVFKDEFDDRLKHTGPGILAMANAGPNTNKQQFYVTLGDQSRLSHLDRKHSVFGAVVKGLEDLSGALEEHVRTDKKDRPHKDKTDPRTGETTRKHAVVVIVATEVLEDPSEAAREQEDKRLTELHEARKASDRKRKRMAGGGGKNKDKDKNEPQPSTGGRVGRGDLSSLVGLPELGAVVGPAKKKTAKSKTKFGDFSSW